MFASFSSIPFIASFTEDLSGLVSGLVSAWNMDDTSGARLDYIGSLDLTANGMVNFTDGKHNIGVLFGTLLNGCLSCASDVSMAPSVGGSVTYTFWFNPTTTAVGYPLSKADGSSTFGSLFHVLWSGSTVGTFSLHVRTTDSAGVTINSPLNCAYQQWHFVALTLGASGNKLSINGEDFVTTGAALVNDYANHSGTPLVVGGRYNGFAPTPEIPGIFDDMTLHNRALSIEEIRLLYNHGSGRAVPYV